ncbi:MAG: OsmC family protein [Ignavibacteria bacterium]|nr:OsmC family protein [Ignavibacteria bacterium]
MKAKLRPDGNLRIIGTNELGLETAYDTHVKSGGDDSAPTPMEVLLQCIGACSYFDVVSILRKKRKTVDALFIDLDSERQTEHPMVFTKVHIIYKLISPDAELHDLERAVELSQEKYCSVSAMVKKSGCEVTWECRLNDTNG